MTRCYGVRGDLLVFEKGEPDANSATGVIEKNDSRGDVARGCIEMAVTDAAAEAGAI